MSKPGNLSLFDPATLIDPYEAYRTLRDNEPVHVDAMGMHVVTRYDLIREALKNTDTFSSKFDGFLQMASSLAMQGLADDVKSRLAELQGQMIEQVPTMLTLDEPRHTQYRSLVSALFTGSQVKVGGPIVQRVIDTAMPALEGGGPVDYMAAFAFPVPLQIIADRLGIPPSDQPFFRKAATAAAAGLRMSPLTPEQMIDRAQTALGLQELLVRLIEERRSTPADDMITILATSTLQPDDRLLTHGEALSILQQFLVAGHETTTSAFGWGMLWLAQNPGIQDEIRGHEGLIRTFVEEALRLESPVQGLPRVVTKDTELGGCPLAAGTIVMLRYGAGNRDERQFEDPDEMNVHRKKAGMQLAFGAGIHHCIGAPLARQELNLGFASLLDKLRNIRLAAAHPVPEAEPSLILRNLPQLHIDYDPG